MTDSGGTQAEGRGPGAQVLARAGDVFKSLGPGERLAALGALAIPVSMLFPWYGFKLGSPLSATALDAFNFAHAALLVTAAALLYLLARSVADPRPLPRPLSVGGLAITAGVWSALVLAFLVADPPDLLVGTAPIGGVRIRYGVFVAAGAAVSMVIGGLRAREMGRGASKEAPRPGIGGAPRDMGP